MMQSMIQYSTAMFQVVADFLATEPVIYLFAIMCMACVVKVFRAFLP